MKDFKELKVWSKAHELTVALYGIPRTLPRDEMYGLTSQLRRSAASIGANIGRRSGGELVSFPADCARFCKRDGISSLEARDLKFLPEDDYQLARRKQ